MSKEHSITKEARLDYKGQKSCIKLVIPLSTMFGQILTKNNEQCADHSRLSAYMFLYNSIWFWITTAIAITTAAAVFLISKNAYPLTYLRQTVGTIFVLLLPGFVFLKTLYPTKIPMATSSENLDTTEQVALGIGLSIALVAIVGLILNCAPWGILVF